MSSLRLTRANQDVVSFLSVLGGLRETRLTAVLGFLMARFPSEFGELLGFKHSSLDEVCVEETEEGDRYDVLVRQSGESHIIEGKIGPTQRVDQLARYVQSVQRNRGHRPALTVVDEGSESHQSRQRAFETVTRKVKSLRFVTWSQVAKVCRDITRKKRNADIDRLGTVIADELSKHLHEHHMTTDPQPEVYLRDMSSTDSVQLYFRHNLYKCQSSFYNSARRNLYFAPYFTRAMADAISEDNLVPVGEGISFVSRVISVKVIETRDTLAHLKAIKHKSPEEAAAIIRKEHKEKQVLIMELGDPRLMFASPVTKKKLNKVGRYGTGAMGSRSTTFDELLAASQG